MKLKSKLILAFLIPSILTLFIGGIGYYGSKNIFEKFKYISDETAPELSLLGKIESLTHRYLAEAISFVFVTDLESFDSEEAKEEFNEFEETHKKLNLAIAKLRKFEEKKGKEEGNIFLTQLSKQVKKAHKNARALINASIAKKDKKTLFKLKEALEKSEEKLEEILNSRISSELTELKQRRDDANEVTSSTFFILLISILSTSTLSIFIAIFIGRRISDPLRKLQIAIDQFGKGKHDIEISINTQDEIGDLARNFKKMAEAVKNLEEKNKQTAIAEAKAEAERERAEDLKQAYDDLKNTQEQLIQSEKLSGIGKLAGGIAHDFNNLLGGMMGYAAMLKNEFSDNPKAVKKLNVIIKSSERAAELTQQLLGFARKGDYKKKKIIVNSTVLEARKLLYRTLNKTIKIKTILDPHLWPVNGDSSQFLQIFMNLGVNARDAMPEGGEFLLETQNLSADDNYCKTHKNLKPGNYILITATDTGTGIPEEVINNIFEPFFTTKEVGKGTGLGLAMIFGIVKNHDGEIIVLSEKNKGTTFHIYIPAITDGLPIAEENNDERSKLFQNIKIKKTILLVEDDAIIMQMAKDILENTGTQLLLAKDGVEALTVYDENKDDIDLIILDIIMPVMDGIKVYKEIYKQNPKIQVLFASGYSENGEEISRILESKTVDFIQKPFKREDLLEKILNFD